MGFGWSEQVRHASEYEVPSSTPRQDQDRSGSGLGAGGQDLSVARPKDFASLRDLPEWLPCPKLLHTENFCGR